MQIATKKLLKYGAPLVAMLLLSIGAGAGFEFARSGAMDSFLKGEVDSQTKIFVGSETPSARLSQGVFYRDATSLPSPSKGPYACFYETELAAAVSNAYWQQHSHGTAKDCGGLTQEQLGSLNFDEIGVLTTFSPSSMPNSGAFKLSNLATSEYALIAEIIRKQVKHSKQTSPEHGDSLSTKR